DAPGVAPVIGCLLVFATILAAPAVSWTCNLLEPPRLGATGLLFLPLLAMLLVGFALLPGTGRTTCFVVYNLTLCLGGLIGGEQRRLGYRLVRSSSPANSSA
ncbi:MAG: hypothetical protein U0836_28150, partial [Pirellulales bacterium]